jgi:hypothetical protein
MISAYLRLFIKIFCFVHLFILNHSFSQQSPQIKFITSFGNFEDAVGITLDQQNNIYIADRGANKIYRFSQSFKLLASIGGYGWDQVTFDQPYDICISYGLNVYICDYGNHRVQRFDRNLNYISTYYTREENDDEKRFGYPISITVNKRGEIFFIDGENKRIMKMNPFFNFEKNFGDINAGEGKLDNPTKMKIDEENTIYVLDINKICLFDGYGNFINRIRISTEDSIKAFYIKDNSIYLVLPDKIKIINKSGKSIDMIPLNPFGGLENLKNITDVFLNDKFIFVLTKRNIFVFCII